MSPPPSRTRRRRPDTRIVTGVAPEDLSLARVRRRFRALLDGGAKLQPAGRARENPEALLFPRYLPRREVRLFDATYFLSGYRYDEAVGYFVAYVVLGERSGRPVRRIHPRIVYKDSSLIWRVASHFVHDHEEYWFGKGDVRWEERPDGEYLVSAEETTNLPYEVQAALDTVSRSAKKRRDDHGVALVLREAPSGRIEPYADFTAPRRRAAERFAVNGGRPVARFTRKGDPTSLRFTPGYEPDFERGVLEESRSSSRFFGGDLRKLRVLSTNREIQYYFIASPKYAWVNPPQALTTELSSYGVRTLDVLADDDVFIPPFEYHEPDEDDPENHRTQIPEGFAGDPHPDDPARSDATAWIEALPVIQDFRERVLRGKSSQARTRRRSR